MLAAAQGLPAGWVRQEALSPDRRIPCSMPWAGGNRGHAMTNEPSRSRCLPGGISGERACGRRGTGRNERVRRRGGAQEPGRLPGEPQGGTEDSQGAGASRLSRAPGNRRRRRHWEPGDRREQREPDDHRARGPGGWQAVVRETSGMAQKSCGVLRNMPNIPVGPQLRDHDTISCVYVAPNEGSVREHALQATGPVAERAVR